MGYGSWNNEELAEAYWAAAYGSHGWAWRELRRRVGSAAALDVLYAARAGRR
jgi:hypothetical protein